MDLGTALSAAQTLFSALQCSELKKICSIIGYKSQLKDFQRTVQTVKNVLLDAQNRQELSIEEHDYIQELKDAVYDADDLLDEFVTLTKQKQLIKGGKLSKDIRTFFSRNNPLKVAYRMSQGVEKIRKNLDAIAKNHTQFGFSVKSEPMRRRREETCSYVYESNIIGREDEVEKIVGHLLNDSNVQQNVSVLTIVGIGGLGKTALAQLIYNDVRVQNAFPLKLWTCVADQDQDQLDVEGVLRKILAAAGKNLEGYNKEWLQIEVRKTLTSSKYLLVLDDLWSECHDDWLKSEEFLLGGQRESRILVTTRSHVTAGIVSGLTHELQGLSKENSWSLFAKIAFGSKSVNPEKDLIELGQDIVELCARVPLAIRVANG